MKQSKRNAFTLIELVAVLVIMTIIALIVTPLVMSIIRKARISADKRSVDAYGRSIELAIAGYLMDNGFFPTDISQLTIEYSGEEVVCTTTQLNTDSSVYLTGCTVDGRNVEEYTYGKEESVIYNAYSIGDEVSYNNIDYYVIKDSDETESTVTLLKAEPLSVEEINLYGTGHINVNTYYNKGEVSNVNGYGAVAYYSSEECWSAPWGGAYEGCSTQYGDSDIKYIIENWFDSNNNKKDLSFDSLGYNVRLITIDELVLNLGMQIDTSNPTEIRLLSTEKTPEWVKCNDYGYWTMSADSDLNSRVWIISNTTRYTDSVSGSQTIRPVITISKSAL